MEWIAFSEMINLSRKNMGFLMRRDFGMRSLLIFLIICVSSFTLCEAGQSLRTQITFKGEVWGGKSFKQTFGPGFYFYLEPVPHGWLIVIRDKRETEDISRLTPPFHFVPNPREIEGWHFRNIDNSGPNEPGEKNVNAPGVVREFIFSPQVGRTIDGPEAKRKPTPKEIEKIRKDGQGKLIILDYRLKDLEPRKQASFEWMRFKVDLSWPKGSK